MRLTRFYAGIGSRETPVKIQRAMTNIAQHLSDHNFICRTGYAKGADQSFYIGAAPNCVVYNPKEIVVPNGGISLDCTKFGNWHIALEIAEQYHGGWNHLGSFAKLLIARNTYQILGDDLNTPSEFVVCWTPDGATGKTTRNTGGTGQAIRIAHALNIPVYNLAILTHRNFFNSIINGIIEI